MWRPTAYSDEDFAAFREAMDDSPHRAGRHPRRLPDQRATKEREIRAKSLASLKQALRVGDGIGADGVVLHAGARKGEPHAPSVKRAGKVIREALESSDRCPVLLENTAGTNGPLGKNFDELAELVEAAGGGKRLGTCLDCCHLFAAGFDISSPEACAAVVEEHDAKVGARAASLRSRERLQGPASAPTATTTPTSARASSAARVCASFLSEPRFEELPALIETPGPDGHGPDRKEVLTAKRLRREGLKERG